MQLSYSGLELYSTCPRRFKYRYIDRVKDLRMSSSLFFGGKLGNTFEAAVKSKFSTDPTIQFDAHTFFDETWRSVTLANDEQVPMLNNPYLRFTSTDHSDPESVEWKKYRGGGYSEDQVIEINNKCVLHLREKGHAIIDRFNSDFIGNVKKLHSTEKKIELSNGVDTIIGYSDIICDYEREGVLYENVLLDFKTSSKLYAPDCVKTSKQLSFYNQAERVKWCGYVVFQKKPTKKDGYRMHIWIDEIPKEQIQSVLIEADEKLTKIENEEFERNQSGCYAFGQPCEYYELCQLGYAGKYNFVEDEK